MYDEQQVQAAVAGVTRISTRPGVVSVRDHFAGYFDELGIWITVADDASDESVISLRNEIAAFLETAISRTESSFKWIVTFGRRGQTVEVISTGEQQRSVNERLTALGKHDA